MIKQAAKDEAKKHSPPKQRMLPSFWQTKLNSSPSNTNDSSDSRGRIVTDDNSETRAHINHI